MEAALKKHLPGGKFRQVCPRHSKQMAAVRGRGNKTTELRLRLAIVRAGARGWQMHPKHITGSPDFYFPAPKVAVFVDGCFWHGCPRCGHVPKKHSSFWGAKIARNRQRDRQITARLKGAGLRVLRFWEHQLAADLDACVQRILVELTDAPSP